jgi:hypothetical protein
MTGKCLSEVHRGFEEVMWWREGKKGSRAKAILTESGRAFSRPWGAFC